MVGGVVPDGVSEQLHGSRTPATADEGDGGQRDEGARLPVEPPGRVDQRRGPRPRVVLPPLGTIIPAETGTAAGAAAALIAGRRPSAR